MAYTVKPMLFTYNYGLHCKTNAFSLITMAYTVKPMLFHLFLEETRRDQKRPEETRRDKKRVEENRKDQKRPEESRRDQKNPEEI